MLRLCQPHPPNPNRCSAGFLRTVHPLMPCLEKLYKTKGVFFQETMEQAWRLLQPPLISDCFVRNYTLCSRVVFVKTKWGRVHCFGWLRLRRLLSGGGQLNSQPAFIYMCGILGAISDVHAGFGTTYARVLTTRKHNNTTQHRTKKNTNREKVQMLKHIPEKIGYTWLHGA